MIEFAKQLGVLDLQSLSFGKDFIVLSNKLQKYVI